MENQKQVRCAIYTRKSTDEGLEKEFNTLEAQREAGENYVKSLKHQGWIALPEHYDDGGYSGGSLKRPALKRLIDDVEAGKVDMIVVYKIDRLTRSLLDFAQLVQTFEKHHCSFVTLNDYGHIETAVIAVPMLEQEDLTVFIVQTLGEIPDNIIVNGTGVFQCHSSIADCGITGRKSACDFYSTACPIGGSSPWTKDPSKADVTLNIYARRLAVEYLKDNDECFIYLSSCIGRPGLTSATV